MAANWLVVTLPLPANHVTADHSDRAGVQPCRVPLFSREGGGGGVEVEDSQAERGWGEETERAAALFSSDSLPHLLMWGARTPLFFCKSPLSVLFCAREISSARPCGYVPGRLSPHCHRKCVFVFFLPRPQ